MSCFVDISLLSSLIAHPSLVMTYSSYDNTGNGPKVAAAIVLNSVDTTTYQWDYAIRLNYTTYLNNGDESVACLYGAR